MGFKKWACRPLAGHAHQNMRVQASGACPCKNHKKRFCIKPRLAELAKVMTPKTPPRAKRCSSDPTQCDPPLPKTYYKFGCRTHPVREISNSNWPFLGGQCSEVKGHRSNFPKPAGELVTRLRFLKAMYPCTRYRLCAYWRFTSPTFKIPKFTT